MNKALLAKIRKCLALSKSSNEHEAAAALAMARRLMEEHGVDDAMLAMADIEEAAARASRNQRPPRWESVLSRVICHALSVTAFINEDGDRCFVGRAPRPEVASYAFAVLFRQLKVARSAYIAKYLKRCRPGRKRQRADVFCEGWTSAVLVKVRELIPAPAEDEAVKQYLAVHYPNLTTIQSRVAKPTRAADDAWRGWNQGSAIELNVGLGGSAHPLAIGP